MVYIIDDMNNIIVKTEHKYRPFVKKIQKCMIISIEESFIQLANKLNKPFLDIDKERLARAIELSYNKIFSVISNLEKSKDSKSTVIELDNVNDKYFFALNLYYYQDEISDEIPLTIKELLPTISPVRLDLMATVSNRPDDEKQKNPRCAKRAV